MSWTTSELSTSPTMSSDLYRCDGYTWSKNQAEALRRRDLDQIDWDNVIEEIESVGRAEKNRWVSHCARAIEQLLAIEYWKSASAGTVQHWATEIRAYRIGMASAIRANPGLQGEYEEMLADAWADGRAYAVERLAGYEADEAEVLNRRPHERSVDAKLPDDCPYLVEHVTAFVPKRDKQPRSDVWPPGVAIALNAVLGTDYEIFGRRHRSTGWSR